MSSSLAYLPAHELAARLRRGEVGCEESMRLHLDRIDRLNGPLNAFVAVDREGALARSRELDAARARGDELGPLAGVPLALKDNICTAGLETTAASRILKGYRPIFDATVAARAGDAGLICIGKTNLDEFAMGSSTEHSAFGASSNPWDLERVPGGSSGGSAVAVAASMAAVAMGSDTGGSIRQPASLCGVVGLKPTYGAVSRFGLIAFASSLDQIGPLARTVRDCALLFDIIGGHDPRDATSASGRREPTAAGLDAGGLDGLRVGVPAEMLGEGVDEATREAVESAVKQLERMGARVSEARLPHMDHCVATYYIVACAEASSNLARYDGVRYGHRAEAAEDLLSLYTRTRSEGFNPEVKRRIILGTYVLSSGYYDAYYKKAQQVRTLLVRDFQAAFQDHDVLVGPVSPVTAFRKGEKSENPLQMYMADVCTLPASLAGLPAISLPCGFSGTGLPVGLQILGRHFEEALVLRVAHRLERELGLGDRHPALD